jgi:hypothetical protein
MTDSYSIVLGNNSQQTIISESYGSWDSPYTLTKYARLINLQEALFDVRLRGENMKE